MWVYNGVLNDSRGSTPDTDLTVAGAKGGLVGVLLRPGAAQQLVEAGRVTLTGDSTALARYGETPDEFDPNFAIVTP